MIPAYLRDPYESGYTYGELSYNRRSKCWTIKGEPCVTELAKRLFPGCEGRGRGVARFTAHRRIIGELNWLMLRYPLRIREGDRPRWEQALEEARAYALSREQRLTQPLSASPPPDSFAGELMPFQREGLGFLLSSRRALLADEMGLGKTVQALAFLASLAAFPALVVAPPHLVRNWQSEAQRFLRLSGGVRVHVFKGLTPYAPPPADLYVIHYLLLRGWKRQLPQMGFQAVIFDEMQELRHGGTEKYSAASLLADSVENVIGLSGTPIYNAGGEIWNVINILDYHCLGDWESFTREWCYGYASNIVAKPELLGEHLRREGLMLRRLKGQVLSQLPPKRRLVQQIDWNDQVYRALMRPVAAQLEKLAAAQGESARAIIEDSICQTQRQATGVAKAPYVCAFVRALLDGGEQVLLFAHHHQVMDIYKQELKPFKPRFITGRENDRQKAEAVSAFMEGKTSLCCISLRSASGLNLQRATCVVFGELDWSPAVHAQAEDRAHRIGQQDSLLCYYLVSPRGSDQAMQEALGLKVSQFVSLMGDGPGDQDQALRGAMDARARVRDLVRQLQSEDWTG
ncbi:MAG TPA: DEAD/DEAH box helicase [Candidatus Excrementavichristensenella intestinipullorum]|nr:DEAD/DEAH box helicase [Candidatus Excrementavichristensenella intestinipullorum]